MTSAFYPRSEFCKGGGSRNSGGRTRNAVVWRPSITAAATSEVCGSAFSSTNSAPRRNTEGTGRTARSGDPRASESSEHRNPGTGQENNRPLSAPIPRKSVKTRCEHFWNCTQGIRKDALIHPLHNSLYQIGFSQLSGNYLRGRIAGSVLPERLLEPDGNGFPALHVNSFDFRNRKHIASGRRYKHLVRVLQVN
jgi:hypothetical protein